MLRILLFIVLLIEISGCVVPAATPNSTAAQVTPSATVNRMLISSSPEPETMVTPTATSQPKNEIIWARYQSSGDEVFVLEEERVSTLQLTVDMGVYYGYNPQRNEILMARDFPDRGAGPGRVSVSDLSILDLDSGMVTSLFDDDVVSAFWSPDGNAIAYVLATDQTYEMHWYILEGDDRILAVGVTFTWSIAPSAQAISFTRESGYGLDVQPGLYVVDIDSGEERLIADVDKQGVGSTTDQPYWSLDSREVILSLWAGPDEPRLIMAMADGSDYFELSLDDSLAAEWWATTALTDIIWGVDGQHLLTLSSIAARDMGGPGPLVYYRLDRDSHSLSYGTLLGEVDLLIGWAQVGSSVWVMSFGSDVQKIILP